MNVHETKACPRCGAGFICKPGNITQCQCYTTVLSEEQKAYIQERYEDCLCKKCLEYLSVEINYFKEKYIYR